MFACCGHGGLGDFVEGFGHSYPDWLPTPYIIERGQERPILYGVAAIERQRELGGNPPEPTLEQRVYWIKIFGKESWTHEDLS